jgi:preprotein translocase subunit SecA
VGFFSKLFGKKGAEFRDRVWSSTAAKFRDLAAQVAKDRERDVYPLVAFHFKQTGELVAESLREAGVEFHAADDFEDMLAGDVETWREAAPVIVFSSEVLPFSVRQESGAPHKDALLPPVALHLAEHHPDPRRDNDVLNLDRVWGMAMSFTCYTGLDEPWLRPFNIERVREMLVKLGIDENTLLESALITSAMESAREKLAKQVHREEPCDSCEEWMRKNLPEAL